MAFVGQHSNRDTFGFICNCSGGESFLICVINFIFLLAYLYHTVPVITPHLQGGFQEDHYGKGAKNRWQSHDLLGV